MRAISWPIDLGPTCENDDKRHYLRRAFACLEQTALVQRMKGLADRHSRPSRYTRNCRGDPASCD
jgi:hypothetical protein